MSVEFEMEWNRELNDGVEATYLVTFSVSPGSPGRLTGPPEHCYPAEWPEVEVFDAVRTDRPWVTSRAEMDALYEDADLVDACAEHAESQWADDGPEYDPDEDRGPDDWMD